MPIAKPDKIGKYEVLDVIGKGGMGIVYKAKDPFLDRMVAIKMMTEGYTETPDQLQRFYREAKSTASLSHSNIVTVFDRGEHEGNPYLVMEYLEGASLEAIVRSDRRLSLIEKLDIIIEVCHGLAYAHQRGIVHRDIKPANIMVLKDNTIKIVDFGIARMGDTTMTRTGMFMGSLHYMSAEQLTDKGALDLRTDVYSTGVVLFQLLTGRLPFDGETTASTFGKILYDSPPPFGKFLSTFPPELEAITLKALARNRDERYASADDLAFDLSQLQERLKKDAVGVHLEEAERLLQEKELLRAHDQLLEVLKVDRQHTRANTLLRTVRKELEKERNAERLRQLRDQAQEAYRAEEFDTALGCLDQALAVDGTNAEIQKLHSVVQKAKQEAEQLRQVLAKAENAHRAGSLDTAKRTIEEVLSQRPNDTKARALYRLILKDWEDRQRHKRVEELLDTARKEMSERRFTSAFNILKEAEKVDPDAPQLIALLERFNAARQQEQRRREVEKISREVEQALNRDDPQSALTLVTSGLSQFPGDTSLIKLKEFAETQNQAAQKKLFVRTQVAKARELLDAGNAAQALRLTQDALQKAPGNPHLESLLSIIKERLVQDRDAQAEARCIQQANDALGRRDYAEAIRVLEVGQLQFAESTEIDHLLRFAREQQAKIARQNEIDSAIRTANGFLRDNEYEQAAATLQAALERAPDDELRMLLEEARRRRDDQQRKTQAVIAKAQQFMREGEPAKAVGFIESQPPQLRQQLRELEQAARDSVARSVARSVPEPSDSSATVMFDPAAKRRGKAPVEEAPPPRIPAPAQVEPEAPAEAQKSAPKFWMFAVAVVALLAIIGLLWPRAKYGSVTVQTNVDSVTVYVDGTQKGTTGSDGRLTIPHLKVGTHEIRVEKQGYETPAPEAANVAKNSESQLSFIIEPPPPTPPPDYGSVEVKTNVDDVKVYVDSAEKGAVGKSKKLEISELPVGRHEIRVEKDGYDNPSQQIDVAKNERTPVNFKLQQVAQGALVVQTNVDEVEVFVDGIRKGLTRANKLKVSIGAGNHEVRVVKEGYEQLPTQRPDVAANRETNVPFTLTAKVAPPAPTPVPSGPFTASTYNIQQGQSVTLNWNIVNATTVNIDGIGSVQAVGSQPVEPDKTTTYTLTATGPGGTFSATPVTITVAALPPTIDFRVDKPEITPGDSAILTWQVNNAKDITIDHDIGTVGPSGSRTVTPSGPTTYTLTARGAEGTQPASRQVQVTVKEKPSQPSPLPSGDVAGVNSTLRALEAAFRHRDEKEIKKIWPSVPAEALNFVRNNNIAGSKITAVDMELACGLPSFSADGTAAKLDCNEKDGVTADGKFMPSPVAHITLSLTKSQTGWIIANKERRK